MHDLGNYNVAARQGYRAIRLPYDVDALGMIIVLPNKVEGLAEVSSRIDAKELAQLSTALHADGLLP